MVYKVAAGHGVVKLGKYEQRNGREFICCEVIANGMTILHPLTTPYPLRDISSKETFKIVDQIIAQTNHKPDNSTWNKRYRDYMVKIKGSNIIEIAEIVRDLTLLEKTKSLSFGERKMLGQCKSLIELERQYSK